jgi:simple sugar transport system ATP-binding protein
MLLEITSLSKSFPGVAALDRVDFTVGAGTIHALLGENGAGKSTLIKLLTGVYPPDSGLIRLDGTPIRPGSPHDAERLGISTVYQEVNLIPSLSVAENITLGRQPRRFGFLDWPAIRRRARAALARLELEGDVDDELGSWSIARQEMVAIARALDREARLLVLDEPTASLDGAEVEELFSVMRRLRGAGMGIVFITHFLDEVYAIADRITVLRNGRRVGEHETAGLPRMELVEMMLGRGKGNPAVARPAGAGIPRLAPQAARPPDSTPGAPVLAAHDLGRRGSVSGISLKLRSGEVTGLAGLLGSGRTETARLLFGIDRPDRGFIEMHGKPVDVASPRRAVHLGLAFCSEDRKAEGILPNLSVRENLVLALQGKRGLFRPLSPETQRGLCDHYVRALRIRTPHPETPVRSLSGGNQQKVLLARWLAAEPRAIILDEPTRGIDIGAKAEIERLIERLRADGLAVLFVSSEVEEVARVCGRAVVLRERRQVGEIPGEPMAVSGLMRMMGGRDE